MSKPFLALTLIAAAATTVVAQETSVAPGVNENFLNDPSVDRFTAMFEGESREIYKHRNEIVQALNLKPGMDVADVGAGTGFFSLMIAEKIAPSGTVFAVDIAENFVEHINARAKEHDIPNVQAKLCTERSVELRENSVDLVFVCDTYHHFEYPFDTLASIHKALRPGGTLVIVDFERVKGVSPAFAITHVRCGKGTVNDEIKDSGFDLVEEVDLMDEQYVLRFKKRESAE